MFQVFLQLPSELRRKIWLATLGPMTLTFTTEHPSVVLARRLEEQNGAEDGPPLRSISHGSPPVPYFGYVELENGASRLFFAVESSPVYQACRESRAMLQFYFAENIKPGGGLPSWYCEEVDIIKFNICWIHDVIKHPWFYRTQHLVLIMWDEQRYLGDYGGEISHDWIEENLHSLRDVTIQLTEGCTYSEDYPATYRHWLHAWFDKFESFYHPEDDGVSPLRFYLRVICCTVPEEEWLSPTNYLRVEKLVHQKMLRFGPQHDQRDWGGRKAALMATADEELDNPAEYVAKRRLARRLIAEIENVNNPPEDGQEEDEEWGL